MCHGYDSLSCFLIGQNTFLISTNLAVSESFKTSYDS